MSSNHPRPPAPSAVNEPAMPDSLITAVETSDPAGAGAVLDPGLLLAGRYEVQTEVARGGMGVVLRARDHALRRDLAVKVLLERHAQRPDIVRRFLEEAQIAGQLQHPGVVPIHEVGSLADGRPFFAMKLVKGRTLAELLKERPNPAHDLPRFLGIFQQVCQTVAYAHSKQVIHRDLKPANFMVGAFGEVQVMDWGLAKVLDASASGGRQPPAEAPALSVVETARSDEPDAGTEAGSVLGTFAYMPPEQARGEVDRLDRRCDVFGLGAVLCEALTGQPPYTGTPEEVKAQAQLGHVAPALARLEGCGADAELVALVKACLQPRAEDRPPDAAAVAGAMTAYLAGVQERLRQAELERAAAQARAEQERRIRRRNRLLAVGVAGLLVLLAGLWLWRAQEQAERRREQAERQAETVRHVSLALGKAEQLRDQVKVISADDVARAQAALALWQQAQAAVEQAEGIAAAGDVDSATRQRLGDLREEFETAVTAARQALTQARKDAKLLADLDEAQLLAAVPKKESGFDWDAAGPALAKAFREYGVDVLTLEPKQVAGLFQQRPASLQAHVVSALEHWAVWDETNTKQLMQVAESMDRDPWRSRLWTATARRDLADLRKLAAEARDKAMPPFSLRLLGPAFLAAGAPPEEVAALMREVQQRHPDDFWLNLDLGSMLLKLLGANEEAIGYCRAAVALRPQSALAHHQLGRCLMAKGDPEGAIPSFRKVIALSPKYDDAHLTVQR